MSYGFTAPLTVPAPTGSHADFSFVFEGTDLKMATVANGGQVVNTVTRNGQTVPADLVMSSDAAATSLYSFGWDYYNPVTGQVKMWGKATSYTAGFGAYVSVGNAAVVTYQGGAQGSEFDSNTKCAYHLPNGSTLSLKDFSATAADLTNAGLTAQTGKIDGAAESNGTGYASTLTSVLNLPTAMTLEAWVFIPAYSGAQRYILSNRTSGNQGWSFYIVGVGSPFYQIGFVFQGIVGLQSGGFVGVTAAWTHLAASWDGANVTYYVNGASIGSAAISSPLTGAGLVLGAQGDVASGPFNIFTGYLDEVRVISTNRSANWLATEFANQSSPPVIGAFTSNGSLRLLCSTGVGS